MGICCDSVSDTNQVSERRQKPQIEDALSQQDTDDFTQVRNLQRRLTKVEKQECIELFLSYKESMKFKTIQFFGSKYQIKNEIGSGSFGSVKLGVHRSTQTPCAIKIIRKSSLAVQAVYKELNKNELEVLEMTQHPNITRIFELLEDSRNYYIIMEVITGGNLFEKINTMRKFTEPQAAKVIKQLLLALNYMHQQDIMHRDLKPENILVEENLDGNDRDIFIKLTDFGFATKFDPNRKQTLALGSPIYMAPELCAQKPYDNKVDVWSVGVITWLLLSGNPPFQDKEKKKTKAGIFKEIMKAEPDYSALANSSEEARSFLRAALQKKASDRSTVAELLNMPWIKSNEAVIQLSNDRQLDLSANLAAFCKISTFQSGVCSLLANLMTKAEDLRDLRALFVKWDTSQDGLLSFEEVQRNMAEISEVFHLDEPDVRKLMEKVDTNQDGTMDYTEFLTAAYDKQTLLSEQNIDKAFEIFDHDGDGRITQEELQTVFAAVSQQSEEVWQQIFEEVDTNRDGFIDKDEFKTHMIAVLRDRASFTASLSR